MKNFLKKIFGGPAEEKSFAHKQRSPRVRIPVLDKATFVAANGKTFPLRNLSETGLALSNSSGERFPDEVSGEIHVGGEKVRVELLAVRRSGDEVGVNFANDPSELRGLLRRVFGDELHAQQMSEVDPSHQKEVSQGLPRWFYTPGHYELFFVELEGKVVRFELEWKGNLMVYADGGLRFGLIDRRDNQEHDKVKHAQSSLVKWADQVRDEELTKAMRLLENVKDLELAHRAQMQSILQKT